MDSIVKDNKWASRLGALPYDLFGKTVLIIGFGRIGTAPPSVALRWK